MRTRFACLVPAFGVVAVAVACTGSDPLPDTSGTSAEGGLPSKIDGDGGGGGGGDGGISCSPGYADCDGTGACATATTNDADNCGRCGRKCGAACKDGRCGVIDIATTVDQPKSVAVNASSVLWVRQGNLESCPKSGCTGQPVSIARYFDLYSYAPRTMLATDAAVFWIARAEGAAANAGKLYRCDVTGCAGGNPVPFDDADRGGVIVANTSTLFWWENIGALWVRPINGTSSRLPNSFAYQESASAYAVDETHIVWSNGDTGTDGLAGVYACDLPCTHGADKILTRGRHVALRGGVVYASRDDNTTTPKTSEVYRCAIGGCGGSGAAVTPANEGEIVDVAVDDAAIYWLVAGDATEPTGTVRACSLPDCAGGPRTLADAQARPIAMTQDADFVYWVNQGIGASAGSVRRVRK